MRILAYFLLSLAVVSVDCQQQVKKQLPVWQKLCVFLAVVLVLALLVVYFVQRRRINMGEILKSYIVPSSQITFDRASWTATVSSSETFNKIPSNSKKQNDNNNIRQNSQRRMSQPQYFTNKIMIFIVVPSLKSQNPRKDQLMLQNQLLILLTQTKMFPRFPRMILCFDGFYYICKDFFILLFLFLKDSLYKMEKYIFDCRQKLYDSPKYLKRNQNISQISHQHHQIQTKAPLPYLKNKVFITFDYSYYRIIPKTASLHINSRVNNSLCSLVNQNQFQGNQCRQSITSFTVGDSKWKKEKENVQISPNLQLKKSCSQKNNGKKIKKPINCMPGVGDYEFQTKTIEKKIVYDVKIRGKPQQSILFRQSQECPDKFGDLNNNKMSQIVKNEKQYKTSKRIGRHRDYNANSLIKDRRMKAKMRQNQEQYFKFINPIDSTNVWNKLMQKYKLKGTKFDTHGFNQ